MDGVDVATGTAVDEAIPAAERRALIYRDATVAAAWGLAVNLGLGIAKAIGGWLGQSYALISDAVNSLGDALTSIVVIVALRFSQRPPDADHPYGHTRAEGIAASNVAVLIIVAAIMVAWEAISRMGSVQPMPPMWTLWIAGGNALIKEALYHYKRTVARRTGSSAILANAWDHRSDAFCAASVLVGLLVVRWGGPAYAFVDSIAALVVVSTILGAGGLLYWKTAHALLDAQADRQLVEAVRAVASEVHDVQAVETAWVRRSGIEHFVEIHIEVDPIMPVRDAHAVAHQVKNRLLGQFATIRDVLVHVEPHDGHATQLEVKTLRDA